MPPIRPWYREQQSQGAGTGWYTTGCMARRALYYSSYDDAALDALAAKLKAAAQRGPAWCIFDNTAAGAAMDNALHLQECLVSV